MRRTVDIATRMTREPAWERLDAWRATHAGRVAVYAASVAAVAAAYYVAARIGLELAYLDGAVAAMWPPVGVGLAVLAIYGIRLWPGVVVADLLVADFSTPIGTVLAQTVGNTAAVIVAAVLFRRLVGNRFGLERVRDVLALVACGALAAGISALFGPTSLWLGGVIERNELDDVFRTWFLSDTSGALVVTPLLLTWASRRLTGYNRRAALEAVALLTLLIVLVEVPSQRDVPYVVFPVLIWAGLRFGPRGAAAAVAIVSALTVWNTAQNAGPFVRDSITHSLLATQLFIAIGALTALILAAVTAERTNAVAALRALAEEQAALRRVATLVASGAAPDVVFQAVTEEMGRVLGVKSAATFRYEDGGATGLIVGRWDSAGVGGFPVGTRMPFEGDTAATTVYRTGEAARIVSYDDVPGATAAAMRELGFSASVAAPITVGGLVWGAMIATSSAAEPLPDGIERRIADFAELAALAVASADAREQLAASRARIVEASDAARRRFERNLHDGAQQRLVSVALSLRLARSTANDRDAADRILESASAELAAALEELRELARGLHPAVLAERGLSAALEALTKRSPVPVELTDRVRDDRFSESVEAAAYYVVSEALANIAKHSKASRAEVVAAREDGSLVVEVTDDGCGGADSRRGTGLVGLQDRVEALGGRLDVESFDGQGTCLRARLPVE
jgi:signal transduction histidine kinase